MKRFIYTLACLLLSIGAWAQNVAKIGGTEYATLADAVAAATDGQTITLISDVTLTAVCNIGNKENVHGRNLSIDFNNHSISSTASTNGQKIFTIYDDVALIGNGEIQFAGSGMSAYAIGAYGNVVIDGVNVTDVKNNAGYIIYTGANATVTLKSGTIKSDKPRSVVYVAKSGTFVMEGGNLISNYASNSSNAACVNVAAGGEATIKGGTLTSPNVGLWADGTLNIEGGTFTSDHIVWVNNGTANISGGDFKAGTTAVYLYKATSKATISGGEFTATGSNKDFLLNKLDAVRETAELSVTGGTFHDFNPWNNKAEGEGTSFVPEDYEVVDNGDGTFSIKEIEYVAQIGENKYESLAEAITAVQNEEIVILLADVTENVTIPAGKNIILDLNGKTLNGGSVASNGNKAAIVNNGTITIKDSSAEQTGTIKREDDDTGLSASKSYYVIDNQGTMTIKSGTITNNAGLTTSHKGSSLIRNGEVAEGAVLNIEGGTLTQDNFDVIKNGGNNSVLNITGGTIKSANSYAVLSYDEVNMSAGTVTGKVCLRSYDSDYAEANITGGIINGDITVETYPGNTPTTLSKCTISGDAVINGTLSVGEGNGNTFTANDANGTIAVSGGTFANPVPEKYCADGFIPKDKGDGTYTVKTGSYVAQIGDIKYESLSAAIAAATADATITLIADINESVTNSNTKNFTIDLNGKTWTSNSYTFINNGGTVTLQGEEGTVKSTAADGIAVWARTGSIIINNGNYENCSNEESTVYVGTTDANLAGKQPTITINGGSFKNTAEGVYKWNTSLLPLTLNIINNIANADTYQAIVVNGGTFFGNDPSVGDDSQLNKINNNSNFVNSEKHAEYKDGVFTIKEGGYKAQTGYIKYVTLDDAIDAAPESATTITLLANAETTKETLPTNVTINANSKVLTMPSFVVLDGQAFTLPKITGAVTYKVHTATYIRTNISATEWGTVCLPFTLTSGNGANYYTYNNISGSKLTVDETTSTVAPNTPVVFKKTTEELVINEENATVSLVTPTTLVNGALVGTYTDANITANSNIYFINGNLFHQAQVSVKVPMYRAYINNSNPSGAKPRTLSIVVADNDATAIEALDTDAAVSAIYDATGRKLSAPQKGINIMKLENGKTVKVMIK